MENNRVMKQKYKKNIATAALIFFVGIVCITIFQNNKKRQATQSLFAMDTYMEITAYGKNSEVAVAAAAVLMILYIAYRFRRMGGWSAGVFSVVALLHDVMYVFAAFVLFRFPIGDSFIAVALTILGYSINATIVVYDRIRENKRLLGSKVTVDEVVNVSINQSLTRSINTTVSTVIAMGTVCVISVIYHVESILVFSLPMLIGMVAGAYSSVCLAGPLWATWQNYKAAQNKQK